MRHFLLACALVCVIACATTAQDQAAKPAEAPKYKIDIE
jgi:hypothetical protein